MLKKDKILSMLNYAICEISGKQYKVIPEKVLKIDFQDESNKDIEAKVLFLVDDGKVKIGKPYIREKLLLKRIENTKGEKLRVSKFHAKANYRRTTGFRPKITKVLLKA